MKTIAAIVQELDTGYVMRIGEHIINIPEDLNYQISQAIDSVAEFNTQHVIEVKKLWNGEGDFSPDIVQVVGDLH